MKRAAAVAMGRIITGMPRNFEETPRVIFEALFNEN